MPRSFACSSRKACGGLSPLLVQIFEERPFGVELRGGAELRHDVVADHMDAHIRPEPALAVAGIGDFPQQGHHLELFQDDGVEGHFIEAVEDFARRARRRDTLDRIDRDQDRVARLGFADQRRQGRIAGIAAVPIGLAVDLDRLEHRRQAGRGEQHVRRDVRVLEHLAATGAHIGGGDEKVDRRLRQHVEIDLLGENVAQRIDPSGVEVIGRHQPGHQIHRDVNRRRVRASSGRGAHPSARAGTG